MNNAEQEQELRCVIEDLCRKVANLEDENAALRRQVEWLAQKCAGVSYSFDAEDWMHMAREAVRD